MNRAQSVALLAVISLLAAVSMWLSTDQSVAATTSPARLDADNPYDLAVDVARLIADGDLANLTDLIIATGDEPMDAIVSAGLAGYLNTCPRADDEPCRRAATLLTESDVLSEVTSQAVRASGVPAHRITIVGGERALSSEVHGRIALTAGWNGRGVNPVIRVAGATRYDTAAAVASHLHALSRQPGGVPLAESFRKVVVATGEHPADALVASTLAYQGQHLLLLSRRSTPVSALETAVSVLGANCVLIVGGTNALDPTISAHLDGVVTTTGEGACGTERIAGTDRHHTAALIATRLGDRFGTRTSMLLTNPHGGNLPLTAAPLARVGSALLYTSRQRLAPATQTWLATQRAIASVTFVGTTSQVSDQVVDQTLDITVIQPEPTTPNPLAPAPADTTTTTTTTPPPATPVAFRAGGTHDDVGYSVSTLATGSAIVTGTFTGSATFGSTTLSSDSGGDLFVAKIQTDGSWAWATQSATGGSDYVEANGVSTLADGSAMVTGTFTGSATFGSTTLTSAGPSDVFVAKIDASGQWVWASRAGGAGDDGALSVSTLADGSAAILTGQLSGSATFGATTLSSVGSNDVFVAKINADGSWAWATQSATGGSDYVEANGVSTLADGSAMVTGTFTGSATFGSTTLTSAGPSDVFVAKIDASGQWVWASRAGGAGDDGALSVSTLADGSAAILTGQLSGSATFGATTLSSVGSNDVFVAKINADGTWAWAQRAGGNENDSGQGVSTLADGSAIITGFFRTSATFGPTTLSSAGQDDVFVARVTSTGQFG